MTELRIVPATEADVPVILDLIRGLAEYEKRLQDVTATEERVRETLFGAKPSAEVVLGYWNRECAGFAVYFGTYSTFTAQPGLYLEDLYVKPHLRGKGFGLALLKRVAAIGAERGCGSMTWSVLSWNEPAMRFYERLGAVAVHDAVKYRLSGEALKTTGSKPVDSSCD